MALDGFSSGQTFARSLPLDRVYDHLRPFQAADNRTGHVRKLQKLNLLPYPVPRKPMVVLQCQ